MLFQYLENHFATLATEMFTQRFNITIGTSFATMKTGECGCVAQIDHTVFSSVKSISNPFGAG
jgi:hypothetical protein